MTPARRAAEATEALRAALIGHARQLVNREGASALTMRALAAEAGCATGLPYKVFADRQDLVLQVVHAELGRLQAASDELMARVGTRTVGANLAWCSDAILDSTPVALIREVASHDQLSKAVTAKVHSTGIGPGSFETGVGSYLAAEQKAGRIDADVDTAAFGFVIAGAIHNLIMSGDAWPRPSRRQLRQRLAAIAAAIAPRS
jgi:AcrR family transcriptional regulator